MFEKCSEFKQSLYEFSFRDMPEDDLKSFLTHAEKCPSCKSEYEKVIRIFDVLNRISSPGVIPEPVFVKPIEKKILSRGVLVRFLAAAALLSFISFFVFIEKNSKVLENEKLDEVNSAMYDISGVSDEELYEYTDYEQRFFQAESLYYSEEDIYFLLGSLDTEEFGFLNKTLKNKFLLKTAVGGLL